jgi:predicted transcriptional regulator of viral defense system
MGKGSSHLVLQFARPAGVLRPRDLAAAGLPRRDLARLVAAGTPVRSGRGLYSLADADLSERHALAEAAKRVPRGVVCLLSACRVHDLTTQNPHQLRLAIDRKARRPSVDYPPLRIVRFSGPALTAGAEQHRIDGASVLVHPAAKTVADRFEYRNKMGVTGNARHPPRLRTAFPRGSRTRAG